MTFASLRARVAEEIDIPDRRTWLTAQLVALEAQASVLADDPVRYEDLVTKDFDLTPPSRRVWTRPAVSRCCSRGTAIWSHG